MVLKLYWDAIAVTAPKYDQVQEFVRELETRQNEGLISKNTLIMAIPDPSLSYTCTPDRMHLDAKIGSGSTTINALFVITEKMSALSGKTYLDGDILKNKRILLLHIGGKFQNAPVVNLITKTFTMMPLQNLDLVYDNQDAAIKTFVGDSPTYPIDILLSNLNIIVNVIQPGLMIASTESMIILDKNEPNLYDSKLWHKEGVSIVTMDVDKEIYTEHGICKVDPETNEIQQILYKRSVEELQEKGFLSPDGKGKIYTSLLYFCQKTTEKMLYLYSTPPMDSCTYLGVDNGAIILKFGIFPDILCCMTKNETFQSYIEKPSFYSGTNYTLEKARKILWNIFHDTPIHSIPVKGMFIYLQGPKDFLSFINNNPKHINFSKRVHSFVDNKYPIECTVVNSILHGNGKVGKNTIINSSLISGNWSIGDNCIILGAQYFSVGVEIQDNMIVSEIRLKSKNFKLSQQSTTTGFNTDPRALVVLGVSDDIYLPYTDPNATIANRSWQEFFHTSGIAIEELWPPNTSRVLLTARLFPILNTDDKMVDATLWIQERTSPPLSVIGRWRSSKRVSIADILGEYSHMDYHQLIFPKKSNSDLILESKQMIEGDIDAEFKWRRYISYLIDNLEVENILVKGEDRSILPFLSKWAGSGVELSKVLQSLDIIALSAPVHFTGRLLSCISDALAIFVNNKGGLRSGPARNAYWDAAFSFFINKDERNGIIAMGKERDKWLKSNESMIRAARHYEGACQIVIKNIVDTCDTDLKRIDTPLIELDQWVNVSLPARIDLAGGWTDTPPICYEHGGVVINVAIKVNGENPIKCQARRIKEPVVRFYLDSFDSGAVECKTLDDFLDYSRPMAPAALLKACFLQLKLIDIKNQIYPLEKQLADIGGGMEILSQSNLPTGSGLGTSSILSACLLAAMAYVYGYKYSVEDTIHAVLKVEQMLTTGGGWQDQVGGLIGGFKEASCSKFVGKHDKIIVSHTVLDIPKSNIELINQHLLLIYTGRTRLARDLLQDVIRRWYAKTKEILDVTDSLIATTKKMKVALLKADLQQIGALLLEYWEQKKCMASGAEPTRVTNLFNLIKHLTYGYSLAGAGGGGFMVVVTKENHQSTIMKMKEIISKSDEFNSVSFHTAEIDLNGMLIN
eukprot:gene1333-1679_t